MINRGVGVVAGAGLGRGRPARGSRCARERTRSAGGRATDMPTFAYSGRTRAGQTVSGERVADTDGRGGRGAAARADPGHPDHAGQGEGRDAATRSCGKLGKRSSAKNLAVFTRQFSVMIDAGLPLVQCLDILGTQEEDKNFAPSSCRRASDVEGGASLADAMRKHPKTFDPLFTNMIAAGEAGGILDTILKRLATYIEKAVKLKGQVKSAMIYPIAVIVIAGVVVGVDSVEGHPDLRGAVRRASAPNCRCRRASSSGSATTSCGYFPFMLVGRRRARLRASARTTPPTNGRRVVDGIAAEAADPRASSCARSPSRGSAARCRR